MMADLSVPLSFPRSRQEQLEWLRRWKGQAYMDDLKPELLSDADVSRLFRSVYLGFLKLEEAAEELML
ncbi:hypothetical protein P9314_25280 [Paenibacillus validus]|uniref:hypothetical protein n=1 Tax=Paenibacillus validus TaxID=44253 RepID=UPI000FDB08E6|nr:hypothetical protein [Paenibacillus validus]MED4603945.1 hypothetical protein [Paenibacillus validus]MED4609549.1 hypothetical protein [Paenibacillus validus]